MQDSTDNKNYKYYAFISYSHNGNSMFAEKVRKFFPQSTLFSKDDMRMAVWLQKKLESYRLPTTICKKFEINPKQRIKPIFRDEDELGCGVLDVELNKNLDASKCLIVLCSPYSAKPNKTGFNHINNEIKHFIDKNGTKYVIPVIINGVPNDSEQECFPPEIKKHNFVAIDVTKIGKYHALSNIVAKMLNLSPDELWQREKRRIFRQKIIKSIFTLLALLLLSFGSYCFWDYYVPKIKYYENIDWKNLEPIGVNELSPEIVKLRPYSWKFIYLKHNLNKVQFINSRGYVRNFISGIGELEIASRNNVGFVQKIKFNDSYGTNRYSQNIMQIDKNIFRVKYENPYGRNIKIPDKYLQLILGMFFCIESIGDMGKQANTPWTDDFLSEGDFASLVISDYDVQLDKEGKINSITVATGDDTGEKIKIERDDKNIMLKEYDLNTNEMLGQLFIGMENGQLKERESSKVSLQYESKKAYPFNVLGKENIIAMFQKQSLSNGAIIKIGYDKHTGNIKEMFIDSEASVKIGSSVLIEYKYNNGYIEECLINENTGKSILKFNEWGDLINYKIENMEASIDAAFAYYPSGKIKMYKLSEEKLNDIGGTLFYSPYTMVSADEAGNIVLYFMDNVYFKKTIRGNKEIISAFSDQNCNNKTTILDRHSEEIEYVGKRRLPKKRILKDIEGNIIQERHNQYVTIDDLDVAIISHDKMSPHSPYKYVEYDDKCRVVKIVYYKDKARKKRTTVDNCYAEIKYEYEQNSHRIKKMSYYGEKEGELANGPFGYAIIEYGYDDYGNQVYEYYYDKNQQVTQDKRRGVYGIKREYENKYYALPLSEMYLDKDHNSFMLCRLEQCFGKEFKYNDLGQTQEVRIFNQKGSDGKILQRVLVKYLYNSNNEVYSEVYFEQLLFQEMRPYIKVDSKKFQETQSLSIDIVIKFGDLDERIEHQYSLGEKLKLLEKSLIDKDMITFWIANVNVSTGIVSEIKKIELKKEELLKKLRFSGMKLLYKTNIQQLQGMSFGEQIKRKQLE